MDEKNTKLGKSHKSIFFKSKVSSFLENIFFSEFYIMEKSHFDQKQHKIQFFAKKKNVTIIIKLQNMLKEPNSLIHQEEKLRIYKKN